MRKGIAFPVTLLALTIVMTALLASVTYLSLGMLKGGNSERSSYQAFLLSESALEAFPLSAKSAGCGNPPPQTYAFSTPGTPPSQATYTYPSGLSGGRIPRGGPLTVQSKATLNGATAILEETFLISCGITGAIPASLTSRPMIQVKGNAQVVGYDFSADTGTLQVTSTSLSVSLALLPAIGTSGSFTLPVQDASLTPPGSYVQIPTPTTLKTYKVVSVNANTLTLKPLFTPGTGDFIAPSAPVRLTPYAVVAFVSYPSTLSLSDARGLVPGQLVRVAGATGNVTDVNPNASQVQIAWTASPPPPSLPEGTPLIAQILGAASNFTISTSGQGQILNGAQSYSAMVPSSPDALFQNTFGLSKADFLSLYPPTPASSFNGTLSGFELKVVQGPLSLSGSQQLCGKGILVVVGNLTVNGSCPQGFQGLLYVAGDYDQQGNAVLTGSVVVEGVADLRTCSGNDCWTQIAGTGQGGGKIVYDPLTLIRVRYATQALTNVKPLASTWRRR